MAQEIFPQGHQWLAMLGQLRAELSLRRGDTAAALVLCDQAQDLLKRLDLRQGLIAETVQARRARVLDALGRNDEALADINQALALWQKLAPAGDLHQIELLDILTSIQMHRGDTQAAQSAARQALALVKHRRWIQPELLARIEAIAEAGR